MLPINQNQYSEGLQALTRETLYEQPIMHDDLYRFKHPKNASAYITGSDLREGKLILRSHHLEEHKQYDSVDALIADGWVID